MLPFKVAATAGLSTGLTYIGYSTEYANSSRKSMQSNTRTALSGAHACAKAVDPRKIVIAKQTPIETSNQIQFISKRANT